MPRKRYAKSVCPIGRNDIERAGDAQVGKRGRLWVSCAGLEIVVQKVEEIRGGDY